MERLLQYLDDIDDMLGIAGLIWERLRRSLFRLSVLVASLLLIAAGVWMARNHPPMALATCLLLLVTLLYRSVTSPARRTSANRRLPAS